MVMVTLLCEAGADIETKVDEIGHSPLSLAMKLNNASIVNYLLSHRTLNPDSLKEANKDQDPLFFFIATFNLQRVKIICEQFLKSKKV